VDSRRVCRPVVADSNIFDKEQYPDPRQSEKSDLDPQQSEKRDLDPHQSDADPQQFILRRIWIRIWFEDVASLLLWQVYNSVTKRFSEVRYLA
jgi:hypothetical protein